MDKILQLSKKQLSKLLKDRVSLYSKEKPYHLAKQLFWSLGVGIFQNEKGIAAWHWGDNGSFRGFFMIYPKRNEILICLTNHTDGLKLMPVLSSMYFDKATWFSPPN
ncbi:MAG: hypothetical protein V4541_07010 [Bacteroidota bacterium]